MLALLLIDIQEGLDKAEHWGGSRNNPDAEQNCKKILEYFRNHKMPLIHIQHSSRHTTSPLHHTQPGYTIKKEVMPLEGETVIQKSTNSAFVGTDLEKILKSIGVTGLIIVGLTTDHCISASVRTAADLGFKTTLISDATATYAKTGIDGTVYNAELIHLTAIASLKDEFAEIVNTRTLLAQLKAKEFNRFL